jgi:SAM-dependent methyltransferase
MTTATTPIKSAPRTTAEYFDLIYHAAEGDPGRLPWSRPAGGANPAFVNWLNAAAPSQVRCGARIAIMGCGLGFDAREAMRRGYEVTGFDCSSRAVAWARRLDPDHASSYVHADLFHPPARWIHRFDLVAEIDNIESLTPDLHTEAIESLANLMTPRGVLLLICRASEEPAGIASGPPWPLTEHELVQAASMAGLVADSVSTFEDDDGVPRIRAIFRRG